MRTKTIEIGGYRKNDSEIFSRAEAQRIAGIGHRWTWCDRLRAIGLIPEDPTIKITWFDLYLLALLDCFLELKRGRDGHRKSNFRAVIEAVEGDRKVAIDYFLDKFPILSKQTEYKLGEYYERHQQRQIERGF